MPKPRPATFLIQDGHSVVFQGDSLTDTDRRGAKYPFGWGYVRMAIDLITARYPDRRIAYYNRGISGNTTDELVKRWHDDCIALKPDWVSLLIGINDLHRFFNPNRENYVSPEAYRRNYETILERTRRKTQARLVLMDPYYISTETDPGSQRGTVLGMLPAYVAVVREMTKRYGAIHVPLHDVFQEQLKYRPADDFCGEPVHPNPAGHMVIAEAWLKALGW